MEVMIKFKTLIENEVVVALCDDASNLPSIGDEVRFRNNVDIRKYENSRAGVFRREFIYEDHQLVGVDITIDKLD